MKEEICTNMLRKKKDDIFRKELDNYFGDDYYFQVSCAGKFATVWKYIPYERTKKKWFKEIKETINISRPAGDINLATKIIKVYHKEAYEDLKKWGKENKIQTLLKCWEGVCDEE